MSDFLSHLAERALGTLQAVQPFIAPRLDPSPEARAEDLREPSAAEMGPAAVSRPSSLRAPRPPRSAPARASQAPPLLPRSPLRKPTLRPSIPRSAAEFSQSVDPLPTSSQEPWQPSAKVLRSAPLAAAEFTEQASTQRPREKAPTPQLAGSEPSNPVEPAKLMPSPVAGGSQVVDSGLAGQSRRGLTGDLFSGRASGPEKASPERGTRTDPSAALRSGMPAPLQREKASAEKGLVAERTQDWQSATSAPLQVGKMAEGERPLADPLIDRGLHVPSRRGPTEDLFSGRASGPETAKPGRGTPTDPENALDHEQTRPDVPRTQPRGAEAARSPREGASHTGSEAELFAGHLPPPAAPLPPVIKVHIGRVEVRAAQPAAPVPRRVSPRHSLNDILAEQRGRS